MATLPTPGGDVDTWGPELNEFISETRDVADDALNLAQAAQTLAQQANATPDAILVQANAALAAAQAASAAAIAAAAAAAEAAALAQDAVDTIVPVSLPAGGTTGQVVTKNTTPPIFADWQDASQVMSVNGDIGDVVITAADVHALADTYVAPVASVNTHTGTVTLTATDVGAVATGALTGLIEADTAVAANTAARHTHSNKAILDAIETALTTAQANKLAGIASGATANSADSALRDRATHTGVQTESTVTGLVADLAARATLVAGTVPLAQIPTNIPVTSIAALTEEIQDRVATMLVQGSGVTLTYDDTAGTVTIDTATASAPVGTVAERRYTGSAWPTRSLAAGFIAEWVGPASIGPPPSGGSYAVPGTDRWKVSAS